jgi:hypothetical protein
VARKTQTLSTDKIGKPGRVPLQAALLEMRELEARTFPQVERIYLRAMREFDELVAEGVADAGDMRNGKGDFFNDMLALLLANCSGKNLHSRPGVPGLSFKKHKLDVAYPASGMVDLVIETKATGLPKHPGNTRQKNPDGRAGSADLEKRIKEASFKNIDIKAEQARHAGEGGGPTSDLGTWIRRASPLCFMFLAVRTIDAADLRRTVDYGHVASVWFDGCGIYCYGWNDQRDAYVSKDVPAANIELDRVLSHVCTALRNLP